MKNEVTLRQFRYFIAAATTGQFSTAAIAEHVSQSAITNAVQSLERRLKLKLFERLPHGVSLTPEGQVFFHHALHVMDAVNDALNHATLKPQAMEGTIRLAATYTVLGYFLPDLLSRYKRSYPNVEIDLIDMERRQLERAVREGNVDLGIGLTSNLENGSIPGALKNVIDWASRIKPMPYAGKWAYLMSASPSLSGGNQALWALRVPFEKFGTFVHPNMFSLASAHEAFNEDGSLKNKQLEERLKTQLKQFIEVIK